MIKKITIFSLLMILILCVPVYAGEPMSAVEATVNRVFDVLRDPKLKGPSAKQAKAGKLRVIYKDMFDEMEFSRRTLQRNWAKFTPDQRKEFVDLFEQVLEKAYLDKILNIPTKKLFSTKKRWPQMTKRKSNRRL